MIIDDNKTITPFHIVNNITIYSDHCSIIVKMNWHMPSKTKEEKYCRIINKKSLHKFRELTNGKFLTNLIKKSGIIDKKIWQNEINKISEKCFNVKKNNQTKEINV